MSTPIAQPAINTLLQYGDGSSPENWTTIANVGSIGGPALAGQVVDVTSHSTSVPWREKVVTLLDSGDITFDVFFIPSDAGHKTLMKLFMERGQGAAGLFIDFRIVFPDVAATKWYLFGFISKFNMSAPVDNVIKAALTITTVNEPIISGVNA